MADILISLDSSDDDDLTPNCTISGGNRQATTLMTGHAESAADDEDVLLVTHGSDQTETPDTETKPKKKGSSSSSDSEADSPPVVKKKRATTRRLRNTGSVKPPEPKEDITAKASIYSRRVESCFSSLQQAGAAVIKTTVVDLSDEEEAEAIFEELACTPPKRRTHNKTSLLSPVDDIDGDCCLKDSQETPEKPVPSKTTCSPSPPPPPRGPLPFNPKARRKRQTKALKNALAELNRAKSNLVHTSFSSDDSFNLGNTPETEHSVIIKVRSRSGVHRFPMKKCDLFSTVVAKLAMIENVPESHCILFLKDTTIEPFQTLSSSGVTVADILQCCIQGEEPLLVPDEDSCDDQDGVINIRVQTEDRKINTTVGIRMDEPLHKVMHRFAQEKKIDVKKLCFAFDGETLSGSETPQDLDMEDGYCIDAIFL